MSRLIRGLRAFVRGSDLRRAVEEEARLVAADAGRGAGLHRRLEGTFGSADPEAVTRGIAANGGWPVRIGPQVLAGHTGLWGPTGAGKSYLLVLIIVALLYFGARRILVLDPKNETIGLVERAIIDVANQLPPSEAEDLLRRVAVLDPFGNGALPNLQVLSPEEGDDPELQAFEVAALVTAELDMAAGFRQESILHRTIECLIRARLPLTVLPTALLEPGLLGSLAGSCQPKELFVQTATRLGSESRERLLGLVARAERLLRLHSTRLALGGSRSCIDFGNLLDDRITLVKLSPPMGSQDIGRFLSGLLWMRLAHAIRRRPNGAPPVHVVVEEWQTFLAAGGGRLAESFADLLRLARAAHVFITVLSQDMASVAKISPTLPEIANTNLHLQFVFRAHDASAWDFILPITGRERRPSSAPWEETRHGYLDRGAELALRRDELARLPDRHCYFADRRTGLPGVLMRTAHLVLNASREEVRDLEERASRSELVASRRDLEAGEREVRSRVARLLGESPPEDPAPLRRRTRGGIG